MNKNDKLLIRAIVVFQIIDNVKFEETYFK